jgi:hypothetical protein
LTNYNNPTNHVMVMFQVLARCAVPICCPNQNNRISQGIGRSAALLFAKEGAKVVVSE